jgi:anti-sigma-K factor RskA
MTHTEMGELYELYALGALDADLASEIDGHVADGCEHCLSQIHRGAHAAAELSVMADPVTPPAEVRIRLLASISRSPSAPKAAPSPAPTARPRFFGWVIPLLAAVTVTLVLFTVFSTREIYSVSSRLERVTYERNQLRSALEILSRRETRTIQFSGPANPAHGTVLLNKDVGFVLVGSDLPALGNDKTYELWAIPAKGSPIPAGLFRTNNRGTFVHVAPQPVNVSQLAAVAVSVEPRTGSPAPTTKPILVIPVT